MMKEKERRPETRNVKWKEGWKEGREEGKEGGREEGREGERDGGREKGRQQNLPNQKPVISHLEISSALFQIMLDR